jgi:hypothetical protein
MVLCAGRPVSAGVRECWVERECGSVGLCEGTRKQEMEMVTGGGNLMGKMHGWGKFDGGS